MCQLSMTWVSFLRVIGYGVKVVKVVNLKNAKIIKWAIGKSPYEKQ